MKGSGRFAVWAGLFLLIVATGARGQERIRVAYSSADASNAIYFVAQERRLL